VPVFNPPGRIDDFARSSKSDELAEGWSAIIDSWLTRAKERAGDGLFYNPNEPGTPSGGRAAPITWDAFPLVISNWFDGQPDAKDLAYRAAETPKPLLPGGRKLRSVREDGTLGGELDLAHRQQDEYCEWFTERQGGRVTGVQFTSEGPEYWEFLVSGTSPFFPPDDDGNPDPRADITSGDPDLALALYREHVSPDVQPEDLVWQHDVAAYGRRRWFLYARKGDYNPLNRWNTERGALHLTHPSNTLQAEVSLAADATVLRRAPSSADDLICCAGYGNVNRSSDPLIGLGVNRTAAQNQLVTLADPVGLYIASINKGALSDQNAWRVARGSEPDETILRARIDVPAGGELEVGGIPLRYGGQVVEHILMILTGLANPHAGDAPGARGCETRCCTDPDRPSFKAIVEPQDDCADVPWDQLAPYVPPREPVPAPAAAAPPLAARVDLTARRSGPYQTSRR
jgi:hypothetical protein